MPFVNLGGGGGMLAGMPILPHGSGAYYNVYGESIASGIVPGQPIGYGKYMAYNGEIIGAAVNFVALGRLASYNIIACNYSTGQTFNFGSNTVLALTNRGSVSYNTAIAFPANGTSAGIGVVTTNPNPYPSIQFASGEYIGIYIDGPVVVPPSIAYDTLEFGLEGTLYLNIN